MIQRIDDFARESQEEERHNALIYAATYLKSITEDPTAFSRFFVSWMCFDSFGLACVSSQANAASYFWKGLTDWGIDEPRGDRRSHLTQEQVLADVVAMRDRDGFSEIRWAGRLLTPEDGRVQYPVTLRAQELGSVPNMGTQDAYACSEMGQFLFNTNATLSPAELASCPTIATNYMVLWDHHKKHEPSNVAEAIYVINESLLALIGKHKTVFDCVRIVEAWVRLKEDRPSPIDELCEHLKDFVDRSDKAKHCLAYLEEKRSK